MKKISLLLFVILLLWNGICFATLPVQKVEVLTQNRAGEPAACSIIEKNISGYFKTPLAAIVKVYEIIPGELQLSPKLRVNKDFLRDTAVKNNVDIFIIAELNDYYSVVTYNNYFGDNIQKTDIDTKIYIYIRKTDQYIVRNISRHYQGDESTIGSLDYLLRDILYEYNELLQKYIPFNPQY